MLVWLTRAGGHRFRSRPRWRTTRQSTCLTRVTLTVTVWRHGGAQGGRGDEAHAPPAPWSLYKECGARGGCSGCTR